MAQILPVSDFEGVVEPPWTVTGLNGSAGIVTDVVLQGDQALMVGGNLDTSSAGLASVNLTTVVGRRYLVRFWVNADGVLRDVDQHTRLLVEWQDGPTWKIIWRMTDDAVTAWGGSGWFYLAAENPAKPAVIGFGSFVATSTLTPFRIFCEFGFPSSGTGISKWHLDLGEVSDVAVTAQLEANLLSDLNDISTAGGFDTDVQIVSEVPEDEQHAALPAIILEPDEGGESEPTELGNRAGQAEQFWNLTLLVRGTQSRDDLQNLLDDVRNAVARSTGALMSNSLVEWATVVQWSAPLASADISTQRAQLTCRVIARYNYLRGNL